MTVENDANGDSSSTVHVQGVLFWMVRWARCAGPRDFCPALAAIVGPVKNVFFSEHYFSSFVPTDTASWAGSRAASSVS